MKTKRAHRRPRQRQLGCEQLERREMLATAGADFFATVPDRNLNNTNSPAVIDSQAGGAGNQRAPRDAGVGDRGRTSTNGNGGRTPRPNPIQPSPLGPAPSVPAGSSQGFVNRQQRNPPPANASPQPSVVTANQALADTPTPTLAGNLPSAQTVPAAQPQIQTATPTLHGPDVVVNNLPAPPPLPPAVTPVAPVTTVAFEPAAANVEQVAATAADERVDAPQSDAFVNSTDTIDEANTQVTSLPLLTTSDTANASATDSADAPLNRSNISAVEPLFASLVDFVSGAFLNVGSVTGLISVAEYFGITFDSLDQDDDESIVADVEASPVAEDFIPAKDRAEEPADAFFELLGDGGLIDFDDDFDEIAEAGNIQDAIALSDLNFAVLDGAAVAAFSAEKRIQRLLQQLDRRREEAQTSSTENADGCVVKGESDSAQNTTSRTASGAQSIATSLIKSDGSCAKWQALEMATGPGGDAIENDGAPTAIASEGREALTAAG